ncbi:MAG: RsmB/NOP family class I SAM-dependent RNA methyltransferase [Victivallales bacterium]|nr:RsmB/NOP family class I SAM-dependent RNA methyltransferase [Victivallales bacterium]
MARYQDIPQKRIEPHSKTCADAVVQLLRIALLERHPADRALAGFLKENHQLGSRDRRIISETLFSVLRWWGWLRHLVPQDFEAAVTKGTTLERKLRYEEFYAALSAAWLLDGREELPPSAGWWLVHTGIHAQDLPSLPPNAEVHARRKYLRPFFENEMPPLPLEDLLPAWAFAEVNMPRHWHEMIAWLQVRPPVWLRAQSNDIDRVVGQLTAAEIRVTRHERIKHALKAHFVGVNLRTLPVYQDGFLEVQDVASQAVGLVCAPQPGESWWDCCAGAGGKTLHLSWLMQGKGTILATDKRVYKLEEDLRRRARRAGRSNIQCKEWLGIDVPRWHNQFHGVLVDAPCSCSGTWRRNPDARWTTRPQDLDELTTLQASLLENASHGVRPGGTLVYATCSMFRRENQDIVNAFLQKHPEFQLEPFLSPLTGEPSNGMLQTWPWDADCDAMFIARLKKN